MTPHPWSHIRWIGGSPCSGKSTIAKHLADQFNLNVYHCDDHWNAHSQNPDLSQDSLLRQIAHMSFEDIFMRPVEVQVETEIAAYQEEFPYILDDLKAYPTDQLLLVEGAALQPDLVAPLLSCADHAIWIVPTEDFQRRTYVKREWMHTIAQQTSDPEQVKDNWMSRDARYAQWVMARVAVHELTQIVVDGTHSIDHHLEMVRQHFSL